MMMVAEKDSEHRTTERMDLALQISVPGQEGKIITISQNGVGLEVITRDTSGLLEREIL